MIETSTDYQTWKMNIIDTLARTLTNNTKIVQQATKTLFSLRDVSGYCSTLMQIIDNNCIRIEIRQASLIQFKNSIRAKWKQSSSSSSNRNTSISPKQKQFIRMNIIQSVLRVADSYPLLKQYKQILTILVGYDYKQWDVISQTQKLLQGNQQNICNKIQVLIAIVSAFEFSITQEEKNYLFKLIVSTLPILADKYERIQSAELTYLLVKYLWRCIHFEINDQIKVLAMKWMPLLKMILKAENQAYKSLSSEDLEFQPRKSNQFYYFHAKKWSLKLIYQFYYKHAKLQDYKQQSKNYKFSQLWYKEYGSEFINVIFGQLTQPASIKIRYYQLRSLFIVSQQNPDLVLKFYEPLLFEILIPYMLLTSQDCKLAHQDPIQLLNRQEYFYQNFKNLKRLASQLWISIAGIGFEAAGKKLAYTHNPGKPFIACLSKMKDYLNSQQTQYKELGLYIFCRMRSLIVKTVVKQLVPQLIVKSVLNELNSPQKMLRARALQVLHQYISRVTFQPKILQKILSCVYVCFSSDPQPIVCIRAALTMPVFFKLPQMVGILKIKVSEMLEIYLKVIDKYDIEPLVNGLQAVVQKFPQDIVPHAKNLVEALMHQFMRLYTKDIQQSAKQNYKGQIQIAAQGCLRVLIYLLDNPFSKTFIDEIHPKLVQFIKTMLQVTGTQYMQNILSILSNLAFHAKRLSKDLWFFYQVAIYSVMGISEPAIISHLQCDETEKYILESVRDGSGIDTFEQIIIYIRWFILKGGQTFIKGKTLFHCTYFELLIELIIDIYKRAPTQYSIDLELKYCIMLMMYFLQTHQQLSEMVLRQFWPIVKHNIEKGSKQIKGYNLQLLSLMIWTGDTRVVALLQQQNLMKTVISQFLYWSKKLDNEFERQRLILGFSQLITLSNRSHYLLQKIPQIYKCLKNLVLQNIQYRLEDKSDDDDYFDETFSDDDEEKKIINKLSDYMGNNFKQKPLIPFGQEKTQDEQLQQILNSAYEDQDYVYFPYEADSDLYWSDILDDMVQTNLSHIDEIKYFKEKKNRLRKNQKELYNKMTANETAESSKYLDIRIQKAIGQFDVR